MLNRLETVTEPSGKTTAYEFDGAGNRIKETITENGVQITTTYNYNEQNRLMSTVTIGGAKGLVTYGYDHNGNLISEDKGTITTHTYDEFNQLNLTVSGSNTIKARYNGEGKRVEREVNGDVTKFLYEGDNVVLEVDATGTELARNIYGNNLIQRKAQGQLLKYFYNGHGDVTALADDVGTIVATYYYDAFGNHIKSTGNSSNPIRYAGYQYDEETKLYYLSSRMYDPETARFLQEDSLRGNWKDPLSLNLYTYCHNEPIMYWDPSGLYDGSYKLEKGDGSNKLNNQESKDVQQLQKALEKLGYLDTGGYYGYYGQKTEDAVNKYKIDQKIDNTGKNKGDVDATTWAKIQAEINPKNKNETRVQKDVGGGTTNSYIPPVKNSNVVNQETGNNLNKDTNRTNLDSLISPVDKGKISNGRGYRSGSHDGVDLSGNASGNLYAVSGGTITYKATIGYIDSEGKRTYYFTSLGKSATIEFSDNSGKAVYGHMESFPQKTEAELQREIDKLGLTITENGVSRPLKISDIKESSRGMDENKNGYKMKMTKDFKLVINTNNKSNEKIQQGETVGKIGNTGNSNGPHCHFSLYQKNSNTGLYKDVDPDKYIKFPWEK